MKVGFHAWEATWGKILTLDQLRRGGDVFFVITRKSSLITSLFIVLRQECYGSCCFSFFSLPWVLSSSVKETFLGWHDLFVSKKPKKAWWATPLCVFWIIWRERKRSSFEKEKQSNRRLKYNFLCNLWSWTKVFMDDSTLSLIEGSCSFLFTFRSFFYVFFFNTLLIYMSHISREWRSYFGHWKVFSLHKLGCFFVCQSNIKWDYNIMFFDLKH